LTGNLSKSLSKVAYFTPQRRFWVIILKYKIMKQKGVLLAVSSLPGRYGVGDFSNCAFDFIKLLKKNNVNLWQILPLNPIGYGHSPYQPFSSYAIDEIYISLEDLKSRGLIGKYNYVPSKARTDYELARKIKENAIYHAYDEFKKNKNNVNKLNKFIKNNPYIDEYTTFITLKEFNDQVSWNQWTRYQNERPNDFKYNKDKHAFAQMILFEEWNKIRKFANKNNIQIVGDVPFYVGYDSSDVYFHKESFLLNEDNSPSWIAGVPPDYFSKDGQRWGNPIWNYEHLYKNEFKAMMDRLVYASKMYDIVRIDHFRAFDSYWAINPNCPTAVDGEWRYPNGYLFFETLFKKYPEINIIVEDLGDLRGQVIELRDHFNLPGMRELEFTIYEDEFLNKRVERENQTYYTTTHDNETLVEWVNKQSKVDQRRLLKRMNELNMKGKTLPEKLIHYALNRKERIIVISVSDILSMDKTQRMNCPGIIDEVNWTFKLKNLKALSLRLKDFY